jgi:hypothetical protein
LLKIFKIILNTALDSIWVAHGMTDLNNVIFAYVAIRGVVEDLSGLRDRGPGLMTRSRPLTFTKAVTIAEPYTLWGSHALTNSIEFRHAKDVKTLELRVMN